jgi:phosphoenolpyruvate---glycerone phosphotransferase subunit DhaK
MPMKKFINKPENLVSELLEGFALANARRIKLAGNNLVVRAKAKAANQVALVTLGGSGHEPALSGFVGDGMLDISVPGDIFAAPGPPRVMEALRLANRPAGVLFIVLNHAGDVMTGDVCMDMVKQEGLNVRQVLTAEDISGGPRGPGADRRGLIGALWVYKIAGAAAEAGKPLDEVVAIAERVNANMATLAVAVSGATHPCTGQVISELGPDEMVVGMGQHGEAGGGTYTMKTADETADIMLPPLLNDLKVAKGEKVMLMLNGVGSTTLMEMYVVLRRCRQILDGKGITLARSLVGEFLTVQEMGGFQMSLVRVDDALVSLWDAPCSAPALSMT